MEESNENEKLVEGMISLETEREYQMEVLRQARTENLIVCLPTGAGKTLIALSLIREKIPEAVQNGKKIIFLANKVHLVQQQGHYIKQRVGQDINVALITGNLNTDNWLKGQWDTVINDNVILVMIDQIFHQILKHSYIKLSQTVLVVLDECHHATGDAPMSKIISDYGEKFRSREFDRSTLPRLLGLTASVIKGGKKANVQKIPSEIYDMEQRFCGRVVTYSDIHEEDVLNNSTKAEIKAKLYNGLVLQIPEVGSVVDILRDELKKLPVEPKYVPHKSISHPSFKDSSQIYGSNNSLSKLLKSCIQDVIVIYEDLGLYCSRLAAKITLAYLTGFVKLMFEENNSKKTMIQSVELAIQRFIQRIDSFFCQFNENVQITNYLTDKMNKLIDILEEWGCSEDKEGCGIVFVERRITAQVLHWFFMDAKENTREQKFIRLSTDFVIGCASDRWGLDYDNMNYTCTKQKESLQKFRNGETNLIFSTSVLEEGLDIRNCNLGVRFDPFKEFPSYVQSTGRVRQRGAKFYVLINSKNSAVELDSLRKFQIYNVALMKYLKTKSIVSNEINGNFVSTDLLAPFCPEGRLESPKVTMGTAIALVYRYCTTLPCDRLAPLCPYSWNVRDGLKYQAFLQFPKNSVMKEVVEGAKVGGKKLAKQAVHLEACRELYAAGALDDHLNPIILTVTPIVQPFIDSIQLEIAADSSTTLDCAKVGTRKRRQWYQKKIPAMLNKVNDEMNWVLYRIKCTTSQKNLTNNPVNNLFDFKDKMFSYGILVPFELPALPPFPIFGHFGDSESMTVVLEKIPGILRTTTQQIKELKTIQFGIFTKILKLDSCVLTEMLNIPFLVVPLIRQSRGSLEINWKFGSTLLEKDLSDFYSDKDLDSIVVLPSTSDNLEHIDLHFVLEISNLTVTSPMTDNLTFLQHLKLQYPSEMISKINVTKPLLTVKKVGKQLNFLSSKTQESSIKSKKGMINATNIIHLPQEFVQRYKIAASQYIQALLLPSCIQRISRMLLAQEIITGVNPRGSPNVRCDCCGTQGDTKRTHDLEEEGIMVVQGGTKKLKISGGSFRPEIMECDSAVQEPRSNLEYLHPDSREFALWKQSVVNKGPVDQAVRSPVNFSAPEIELTDINKINLLSIDKTVAKPPCVFSIMQAMTLANANDGMNLERLEFIGDLVLKYISTLYVFEEFPQSNEGQMTYLRNVLVSNANFYRLGKKRFFGEYLSASYFSPDKTWLFPGVQMFEVVSRICAKNDIHVGAFLKFTSHELKTMTEDEATKIVEDYKSSGEFEAAINERHVTFSHGRIGDKNIADCFEALVGAYYIHGGFSTSLQFMDWIGLTVPTNTGSEIKLKLITEPHLKNMEIESSLTKTEIEARVRKHLPSLDKLERRICYTFRNEWLALEAFTYPDYVRNDLTDSYQRLEFLGDTVLDFLIANHVYNNTSIKTPGELTNLKSALVNNFTLASLAVRYNLHSNLLSAHSKNLQNSIDRFVSYQETHKYRISGELPLEARANWEDTDIAEIIDAPKPLGDIFESLIGAIFVDSGYSLDTTWKIVYRLMEHEIVAFSAKIPRNAVAELHEKCAKDGKSSTFSVIDKKDLDEKMRQQLAKLTLVKLTITDKNVLESDKKERTYLGRGLNKETAKRAAAQWALHEYYKI